jgi:hypothetical protein
MVYTMEKFDAPTPTLNSVYRITSAAQPAIFDGIKCWVYTGPSSEVVFATGTWGTPFFDCAACTGSSTTTSTSTSTSTSTTTLPITTTSSTSTSTTTAGTTTTTAPTLSYYIVKECGTATEYEVSIYGSLVTGTAYKLMTSAFPPVTQYDGSRCWYIDRINPVPGGSLVQSGNYYPDCSGCLAATTTTSTSTSTSSTSTTTGGTTSTTTMYIPPSSTTSTTDAGTTTTTMYIPPSSTTSTTIP